MEINCQFACYIERHLSQVLKEVNPTGKQCFVPPFQHLACGDVTPKTSSYTLPSACKDGHPEGFATEVSRARRGARSAEFISSFGSRNDYRVCNSG